MPTLEEVKSRISHIDEVDTSLCRWAIKALPDILYEDEILEDLVQGWYEHERGILCATNKRLIFLDKGIFRLKVKDFPYDRIDSIQYQTGILEGKITIFAAGDKAEIDQVFKEKARDFAKSVRARITANLGKPASNRDIDTISALERLAKLKESGMLTDEELQAEKAKIIAR